MSKYQVSIGRDFPIDEVSEKDAADVGLPEDVQLLTVKHGIGMREALTWVFLIVFTIALAISAFIGWHDGSFDELSAVWAVGAVWFGFLLKAYFRSD